MSPTCCCISTGHQCAAESGPSGIREGPYRQAKHKQAPHSPWPTPCFTQRCALLGVGELPHARLQRTCCVEVRIKAQAVFSRFSGGRGICSSSVVCGLVAGSFASQPQLPLLPYATLPSSHLQALSVRYTTPSCTPTSWRTQRAIQRARSATSFARSSSTMWSKR